MKTMLEQMLDKLDPHAKDLDLSDRMLVRGLLQRLHAGEVVKVTDDHRHRLAELVTKHCIIPEAGHG